MGATMTHRIVRPAPAALAALALFLSAASAASAQAKASSPAGSPYGAPLEPFLVLLLIPVFGIIAAAVARVTDRRVREGRT
jgi:hypothetical protein